MEIRGFVGEHRWLSNFVGSVEVNGRVFPTVEHAFHAAKTLDKREQELVRAARTPGEAKRLGRKVTLRAGWDGELKIRVMRKLVELKFAQHPELRAKLLATGDALLVEANTWGDRFWGVSGGVGRNALGEILMEVRKSLR